MTTDTDIPHHIVNEAVGGSTSADGLASIQGILTKHLQSYRFLIQYGMNDARPWLPIPSGRGLSPGESGYPGTFKDNMQQIIDAINTAEIEVCLSKTIIALGDSTNTSPYPDPDNGTRSLLIKEFNEVIDELYINPDNKILVAPPDFYGYYNTYDNESGLYHYENEYFDNIHPNGIGYHSMATLWLDELSP